MKNQFLLPLMSYPDHAPDALIANAVDLARNRGALLHAVAIEVNIPPIVNPWSSLLIDTERMVREAEHASRVQAERLLHLLQHQCAAAGVALESERLVISQPEVTDAVAQIARHYDLTLLPSAPQFRPLSEAVIFGSGRPAILYPDNEVSGRVEHVAIAWDGSRAAARALADAWAFVDAAARVSIVYALDDKPEAKDPGKRIFDSLLARGVKAEAHAVNIFEEPIGDVLQSRAVELEADLLVMGGYGHSRMREFVLGGATAHVLDRPQLPILMSH